jgi:cytochrome c peroxidase
MWRFETILRGGEIAMRCVTWILFIVGLGAVWACSGPADETESRVQLPGEDPLWERATLRFKPLPASAPNPANPVTAAKIELGRALYFDTQLSREGNISCNTCHDLASFGVDNKPTSPGDTGDFGDRNSPTVLNAALHLAQFWDGRAEDVEEQAGMPILNPVEMAIPSEEFLVQRLTASATYPPPFAAAFPDEDDPLTYRNTGRALAAYERTLLTPARFDAYLEGNRQALTAQEKAGLRKFMALGCSSCHNGVTIGGYSFRRFGLGNDYWVHTGSETIDEGRFALTGLEEDKYVFKVAALRNIAETYPYFHDGSVETLVDAVRVMGRAQLQRDLTPEEAADIAAFLESLTGEIPQSALPRGAG